MYNFIMNSSQIIKKFKSACAQFPEDRKYREILALSAGLDKSEYYLLRPIIGENELKYIIPNLKEKNFMPGVRQNPTILDSHNDSYLRTGDFKANLHIHTTYSDGLMTVDDFLDSAVELANKNFSLKQDDMPLIVAITDHDCISGAKEVVFKIIQNPERYKNVRIVLGVELSTITNKFKNLKKPLLIHTHMFCINPFDKDLNDFIDYKIKLKKQLAIETMEKLNIELNEILKRFNLILSLEEVATIHELILKGQDEICIPMKKYTGAKLLYAYYVEHNQATLDILKENNINIEDLSFQRPIKKYKKLFKRAGGFAQNYKEALELYLSAKVHGADFSGIFAQNDQQVKTAIKTAVEIAKNAHPTLSQMPDAFDEFEKTLETLSKQPFGVFGIAHPGRTLVRDVNSDLDSLFDNMFSSFKKFGKEKAIFYEGYYQSYDGEAYSEYLPPINRNATKYGLLKSGGMDSHGPLITERCAWK